MRAGRMTQAMRRDLIESRRRAKQARIDTKRYAQSLESPGRRVGAVAGSWVSDIASIKQMVLLCLDCKPKFDPAPYQYVHDKYRIASGKCDGCRKFVLNNTLQVFQHESYLSKGYVLTPAR